MGGSDQLATSLLIGEQAHHADVPQIRAEHKGDCLQQPVIIGSRVGECSCSARQGPAQTCFSPDLGLLRGQCLRFPDRSKVAVDLDGHRPVKSLLRPPA
jgi:hypothetical protein